MEPMAAESMPRRMFISYSSHDAACADALAAALEATGVSCWIAPRDVAPGTRYAAAIIEGIAACSLFVLLLSEHSNASPQVLAEVERAASKGLPLLTIRLEPVSLDPSLEYFLSAYHWIDAFAPFEPHLDLLADAVRQNGGTRAVPNAGLSRTSASIPSAPRQFSNNLPAQTTSFIGREKELEDVTRLLPKTRLLTLTGAGGAGKTRLSLRVASELLTGDGDGVWLVELAPLTDPALVPQAVADVFGIRETTEKTLTKTLVADLKDKRLLLILDNCEHVVSACASLAADLLRSCPGMHLLASSREPLGVPGEQVYRVPSLSLPDPNQAQTALSLPRYESARLMIERAQAVRSDFVLTDGNAPAVAEICRHLDGIPLAIELAAARVRSLSVEDVNTRLDQRFRLLTGGSKTLLPRQQTLRALIDWSYDLLSDQEKTLLQRLSVFTGGWCLEAAEMVGAGGETEDWEVLDLLTGLVDKSLVIAETAGDAMRYRMLESIRQYALERLQASDGVSGVRARHAAWCLSLAETAFPMLRSSEAKTWLSRLDLEHDNLRAALAFHLERDAAQPSQESEAWRLAGAMTDFWYFRGYLSEGRRWLASVAAGDAAGIAPDLRFVALRWAGIFATIQCDYAVAQEFSEAALALAREMGDWKHIAKMLGDLGSLTYVQGNFAAALSWYEQGLQISRETGEQRSVAVLLTNAGNASLRLGDYSAAQERQREALDLFRQLGDRRSMAVALSGLGSLAQTQGDFTGSQTWYEQALELFEEIGDKRETAMSRGNIGVLLSFQGDCPRSKTMLDLAIAALRELGDTRNQTGFLTTLGQTLTMQGEKAAARTALEEGLSLAQMPGNEQHLPYLLRAWAEWASAHGLPERAATLYGAADAMATATGEQLAPFHEGEKEREMDAVRAMLGDAAFDAALRAGQAMTRAQIVELARMQD